MELRQPITRTSLKAKFEAAQAKLDDAIERKSCTEADPLQEDLELLVKKREDLPTVEELKDDVAKAETTVAKATKTRDFASAASLQASSVDNAKKRLDDTLDAEALSDEDSQDVNQNVKEEVAVSIDGLESRADLESGIVDLQSQIKEAIAKNDFKEMSSLQSMLDGTDKLREHFLSLKELEAQVQRSKQELDEAVASKYFVKAGKLHEEIDMLENKVESPKSQTGEALKVIDGKKQNSVISMHGGEKTFKSRFDLEQEPSTLRGLLAGKPSTVVAPDTCLLDAGILMAEHRKAALIVEGGNLIGIVGLKDMMTRAVAK